MIFIVSLCFIQFKVNSFTIEVVSLSKIPLSIVKDTFCNYREIHPNHQLCLKVIKVRIYVKLLSQKGFRLFN